MKKFILLWLICFPPLLFSGITGKLSGNITDAEKKEPIIGATIILQGTTLGAATDINGNFVILNIPPGVYNVKISAIGYKSLLMEKIRIFADQTTKLDLKLTPSAVQLEDVVVTSSNPMIQKDLTSSISVVSREQIDALPVSNVGDILALQAGVVGSGSNIHIRGGRSNEVAYMVDGMYVKDPLFGTFATDLNNDAIQELSLMSGTFNAEYGNALSGVVNIVTRDGSDDFSGKIETRTSEFGIKRYKDLHELRMIGSFSGPLLTNKIKFFISGERNKMGSYLPWGYDNLTTSFGKISFLNIPSAKITISNRGSWNDYQNYNHEFKYIPEQYLINRTRSNQTILTLTHTIDNNLFYDLRASFFTQSHYTGLDKDTALYMTTSQWMYVESAGNGYEFYSKADPVEITDSRTSTAELKGDGVWQLDKLNEIKFGFQFKKHWLKLFYIYDPKRNYPYLNDYKTDPFEGAAYIQDKIEFPFLVINLGLRFDYLNANAEFRSNALDPNSIVKVKSRTQLSPRIGIAHPISDKTKIHFSYGHFFQNPDFQYLFENKQYDLNVREPLFGQANLDAERTIAYETGISHQFSDRVALNLTAYYKDVTGLIGTRYYLPYVDGRYTGYTLYVNESYANMKGFEINLNIRPDNYFSGEITYSYSVAKGNASSEQELYPGTDESTLLYYLNFDKTHVFNASGSFTIPKDDGPELFGSKIFQKMDLSLIYRTSSGYPYTPTGRDIGFVVKNSLRMPSTYSVDLEIGKEIELFSKTSLRIFAEVLNLTDHKNIINVYTDTGDPEYTLSGNHSIEFMHDPSYFGAPRQIRLGVGFKF
jgi:outer membrane receptor for ferrienterochelin and colicin